MATNPDNSPELNDAEANERIRQQVFEKCREIPEGKVTSYGALGALCAPPISGYICGRIMGNVTQDVPWWRVVAKDGKLPIGKRGPYHSQQQRQLLEQEGIEFDEDGKVQSRFFVGEGQKSLFDSEA